MIVRLPLSVSMPVFELMPVLMPVPVPVPVPGYFRVRPTMRMFPRMVVAATMMASIPITMARMKRLLRQGIIFSKGRVMAMLVTTAIGARFGFEGGLHGFDGQSQPAQQVPQHGVRFQLQITGTDFHRRMTITQMIGRAKQQMRVGGRGAQHWLCGGHHAHEAAIVSHQHVTASQHGAARQE